MAECTNRVFPPTLPSDYERKEPITEDRSGQTLFLVDGVAVYVLVERRIGRLPFSLLIQLPGITKDAVKKTADIAEC